MKRCFALSVVIFFLSFTPVQAQENFNIQELGVLQYDWSEINYFVPAGDIAFCLTDLHGLSVFDISDVENVNQTAYFELPSQGKDIIVRGEEAFVAVSCSLMILDVSNPNEITELASFSDWDEHLHNGVNHIAIEGEIAVVKGQRGISIVDISDLRSPVSLGYIEGSGNTNLTLYGEYIYYYWGNSDGIRIINFSDPNNPRQVGTIPDLDVRYFEIVQEHLLIVNDTLLLVYDLADPENPELISQFDSETRMSGLYVSEGVAYTRLYREGILMLDLSDVEQIESITLIETPITPSSYSYQDGELYISAGHAGLLIADVSNPEQSEVVSSYGARFRADNLEVSGDYIFSFHSFTDLSIYDISDPGQIRLEGFYGLMGRCTDMTLSGDFIYSTYRHSLRVVSIDNPEHPLIVAETQSESRYKWIEVEDGIAYIIEQDGHNEGITTIDVSDPENPEMLGQEIIFMGFCSEMYMDSDRIYTFSDSLATTIVYDVSNPAEPELLSIFHPMDNIDNFEVEYDMLGVHENHLYYRTTVRSDSGDVYDGIHIFDATNLEDIQFIGRYHPEGFTVGGQFDIQNQVTLVGISYEFDGGLGVLDLSDPADPVVVGYLDSAISGSKRRLEGETAVLAGSGGIGIYDCSEALAFDFPPSFTNTPPETLEIPQYGAEVNFVFTGWDRKGDPVSFSMNWEGENPGAELTDMENGTGEFHWTPREYDTGWHTVHLIISDGALTDTTSTVFAVGNVQSVETESAPPSSMFLLEAYPNPFNSMTTIRYTTPNTSEVKLTIYDVVGRQIADLFFGTVESGGHSFVFDGSGFESGVYVVRLTNGGEDKHEKILLVK
ncbi:MAG: T9SS type A sorting domain-containing protein [Calditrichaeota bacterium]|nr:T9SS type A sorting domain-containing protein [Calditrichota bacterium]